MTYVIEKVIQGLPKMTNAQLRGHWRVKHANALRWKLLVSLAFANQKPEMPLERAKLTLTRCSTIEPDSDGLVSGFKHIIDGLVECQVLANDKPKNIGFPDYRWARAKARQGHIIIRVEEIKQLGEQT